MQRQSEELFSKPFVCCLERRPRVVHTPSGRFPSSRQKALPSFLWLGQ
nr:MAG TPA: hypothetical protein [Caudoviricetes sp.]